MIARKKIEQEENYTNEDYFKSFNDDDDNEEGKDTNKKAKGSRR